MNEAPTFEASADVLKRTYLALRTAQARLRELESRAAQPIAVVGMACRLPGGADDPEALWDLMARCAHASVPVPPERWSAARFYDPAAEAPGRTHAARANFLTVPVDGFDAAFFGISAKEAISLDPQQRLLLELAWEALERAGIDPAALRGSRTGVFAGISSDDYAQAHRHSGRLERIDGYALTGTCFAPAAGRLSYCLGLEGPSLAVDTACSSSLVAVHLACQSLRQGESDLALAAGVNLILSPVFHIASSKLGTISPDGLCKTFDAAADGYGRGEGGGVVVLKRLAQAQADGDPILAVIRGSAVNQDGRSNGLTAPNGLAQEKVIRQALAAAGLAPSDIGYIEVHGTGTPLGDPIEVEAIGRVMHGRPAVDPVILGTVKTNIGHLEAAAGLAGLIRTILVLDRGTVPRHLHLDSPSRHIPWGQFPFTVAAEGARSWAAAGQPRRAGVSSFGFSGTNAHVVLEAPAAAAAGSGAGPQLLVLSARTAEALTAQAGRWAAWVAADQPALADAALTAGAGRSHFAHRLAVVAETTQEAAAALGGYCSGAATRAVLAATAPAERPRLAMLFTGQGAQAVGMGAELYRHEPVFRATLEACDTALRETLGGSLIDRLYGPGASEAALRQTALAQPALFAVEVALFRLWQSWGIAPDVVCGHSIGEFAAAHAAGVLDLDEALTLVATRGSLMQALPAGGGMVAVFADLARLQPLLPRDLAVAAVNRPGEVVVAGPAASLGQLIARLAEHGVDAQPLRVSHAFHSPMMRPVLDAFAAVARGCTYHPPRLPMVSTVTGGKAEPGDLASAAYWCNQIEAPVRFAAAAETLAAEGVGLCLEIGPAPILTGLVRQIAPWSPGTALASLKPGETDRRHLLGSLGALYGHGFDVDWKALAPGARRLAGPTYPFQRKSYYLPPDADAGAGVASPGTGHPLLGQRLSSPALPAGTVLHQALFTAEFPGFLRDHQIFGRIISPAAAHLAMALAAAGPGRMLEDVAFTAPLVLAEEAPRLVQLVVESDGAYRLVSQAAGQPSAPWTTHSTGRCVARARAGRMVAPLDALSRRCPQSMTAEAFYGLIDGLGYHTGPSFRCIRQIACGTDEALCRVEAAVPIDDGAIHPGLIDCLLQTVLPACQDKAGHLLADGHVLIPLHLGRLCVHGTLAQPLHCHSAVTVADGAVKARITAYDSDGGLVLEIADFLLKQTDRATLYQGLEQTDRGLLYAVDWQPLAETPAAAAAWVVVDGPGPWPAAIAGALRGSGAAVVAVPADAAAVVAALHAMPEGRAAVQVLVPAQGAGSDPIADTDRSCRLVLELVQALAARPRRTAVRLWLVTRAAQTIVPEDVATSAPALDGGALWGLGRAIATEFPELRAGLIDVSAAPTAADLDRLPAIAGLAEDQIGLRRGAFHAARLGRLPAPPALDDRDAGFLDKGPRQTLDDLTWRSRPRWQPGPGEVEVAIEAAGLNFRDVLNALGQYPGDAGLLGFEAAGTVVRLGEGVADLVAGQPVILLGAPGCIASHMTVARTLVVPRPAMLAAAEAVTLPAAFLTAHYALNHLGRLRPGERVLIHAAAGGVGLAAVQLARAAGAEIFATVGSADKVAYLESLGIRHIYASRTLDFAAAIAAETGGRGVDLVLNALSGAFIGASFAVLAPGGRFLEMGKIGIWDEAQAAARDPACFYRAFDLAAVVRDDPALIQRLFTDLIERFAAGELTPLPRAVFPMAEAAEAFRYMAQARHIGKIVLSRATAHRAGQVAARGLIRGDASYLVTGGLGALGLRVAAWLVEAGARHLVLVGRRPATRAAEPQLERLRQAGATVTVLAADLADPAAVAAVMDRIGDGLPPLKGIVHAAGVLADGMLGALDWTAFQAVMAPKVRAAWHLHQATLDHDLDLFVLFSSVAAIIGNLGQGNYAAANGFMDGLAQERRRRGLAATSINWGPWAETGMAAALESDRFAAQGIGGLPPAQGLRLLDAVLREAVGQPVVAAMDWPAFAAARGLDGRSGLFAALLAATPRPAPAADGAPAGDVVAALAAVLPAERPALLRRHLQDLARETLGYGDEEAIALDRPLVEQGFDSLMSVDMRNRLNRSLGQVLPASLLFDYPTLDKIARHLLAEVLRFDPVPAEAAAAPSAAALLDELERLIG